jgi:hypothetical protein
MALTPEQKAARESRLDSNAGKRIKNTSSITETKVNTPGRQAEVSDWQKERPAGGNRADYIAWAKENPNQRSNSARRLGKKAAATRASKAPVAPAPVGPVKKAAAKKPKNPKK